MTGAAQSAGEVLSLILMAGFAIAPGLDDPLVRLVAGLTGASRMGFGLVQPFLSLPRMAGKTIDNGLGLLVRLMALQAVNLHGSVFRPGNLRNLQGGMAGETTFSVRQESAASLSGQRAVGHLVIGYGAVGWLAAESRAVICLTICCRL